MSSSLRRSGSVAILLSVFASTVFAHVTLLSPNGGQVLKVGQVATISWTPSPEHNTVNWHLDYSTSGPAGPWISVALNLPPTNILTGQISNFSWVVPATPSTNVYVRVIQDNTGTDYDDVSDAALSIVPSFTIDQATASIVGAPTRTMSVDAGVARAGDIFVVVGSVSGAAPGFVFGSAIIPVNPDFYFNLTVSMPNVAPLVNSLGSLDAGGQAQTLFTLPVGLPPTLAGFVITHACVAVAGPGITFVSNAVNLTLVP